MLNHIKDVEEIWQIKDQLTQDSEKLKNAKTLLNHIIDNLNHGVIRVCEKRENEWQINEWIKKAILLYFVVTNSQIYSDNYANWYDKIPPKFPLNFDETAFKQAGCRVVPGAFIRTGSYIGKNVVIMPSFINIGAYIGDGTLIDSWATVGSCVQIGQNCHISGGAGIGGVLEPLQAQPVIIEDNCFIGARSEIVEGVIIEEGSVISMGVFIGASTKIVYRDSGKVIYHKVPPYSVVVPGAMPAEEQGKPGLYCAVIIKQVDHITRKKTAINELLRI